MQKILLWGVFILAFLLRIWQVVIYPVGFTPDEASHGYDAYSLLKTGHDQWGRSWPLSFESFGDFKPPLYVYLTIPFVALFGLNEFSIRLPNVIMGTLAVLATYLLAWELFKNKKIALVSAFFLAVSPWHMPLSKGAFEANLTTFLLPFGAWLFLTGRYLTAGLVLGLNLLSYHSAVIVTPFVTLALVQSRKDIYKFKSGALVFIAFLALVFYSMFFGGNTRGADIAIFNPTDRWETVVQERYHALQSGLPDLFARAFNNKLVYTIDQFAKNYLSYFSIEFLGTQGAGEWTYGMVSGQGVLYFAELIFLLFTFWDFVKNKNIKRSFLFLFFWLLVSPIPAALTKGPGHAANRVAVMMPALQILSAYGAVVFFDVFKKIRFVRLAIVFIYFVGVAFFFENYFYRTPINAAPAMLFGRQEAVEIAKRLENNYTEIIFSRQLSEPHIFVAFYNAWDPVDYQTQSQDWQRYKTEKRSFVDQLGEYRLGKYTFTDVNYDINSKRPGVLLIGRPEDFPKNIRTLETVLLPDGKPAILIVDPQKATYAKAL